MNTSKLWSSFQLREAAKRLYNFAANRLHYAAKRLCSDTTGHQITTWSKRPYQEAGLCKLN